MSGAQWVTVFSWIYNSSELYLSKREIMMDLIAHTTDVSSDLAYILHQLYEREREHAFAQTFYCMRFEYPNILILIIMDDL